MAITRCKPLPPRSGLEARSHEREGRHVAHDGIWPVAVCRPGREPVEIRSGELSRVEVGGKGLHLTRMEYDPADRQYYSIDGYPLRDGLRAAIGGYEELGGASALAASPASSLANSCPRF